MVVSFENPTSPETQRGRDLLDGGGVLRALATDVNQDLAFPHDIALTGGDCGEPNAFYSPDEHSVRVCYEMIPYLEDTFAHLEVPNPQQSTINVLSSIFYHEMGHAVIDLYDLPFTGREEDVADQLAATILLAPTGDDALDEDSENAALDVASFWGASYETGLAEDLPWFDVHSMSAQRAFNQLCWIYGRDPQNTAWIVDSGALPKDRASGCHHEYQKMTTAWSLMLRPYLKE